MLEIGLSCVDITPPVGIRMRGFAAREPSVRVHDELKAESLVLSDGRTIAALVSCDLCSVDAALVKMIREEARMRTGIPKHKSRLHARTIITGLRLLRTNQRLM